MSEALQIQRKIMFFHILFTCPIFIPSQYSYVFSITSSSLLSLNSPNPIYQQSIWVIFWTQKSPPNSLMISYCPKDKIKTRLSITQASTCLFSLPSLHVFSSTLGSNTLTYLSLKRLLNMTCGSLWFFTILSTLNALPFPVLDKHNSFFYFLTQT